MVPAIYDQRRINECPIPVVTFAGNAVALHDQQETAQQVNVETPIASDLNHTINSNDQHMSMAHEDMDEQNVEVLAQELDDVEVETGRVNLNDDNHVIDEEVVVQDQVVDMPVLDLGHVETDDVVLKVEVVIVSPNHDEIDNILLQDERFEEVSASELANQSSENGDENKASESSSESNGDWDEHVDEIVFGVCSADILNRTNQPIENVDHANVMIKLADESIGPKVTRFGKNQDDESAENLILSNASTQNFVEENHPVGESNKSTEDEAQINQADQADIESGDDRPEILYPNNEPIETNDEANPPDKSTGESNARVEIFVEANQASKADEMLIPSNQPISIVDEKSNESVQLAGESTEPIVTVVEKNQANESAQNLNPPNDSPQNVVGANHPDGESSKSTGDDVQTNQAGQVAVEPDGDRAEILHPNNEPIETNDEKNQPGKSIGESNMRNEILVEANQSDEAIEILNPPDQRTENDVEANPTSESLGETNNSPTGIVDANQASGSDEVNVIHLYDSDDEELIMSYKGKSFPNPTQFGPVPVTFVKRENDRISADKPYEENKVFDREQ